MGGQPAAAPWPPRAGGRPRHPHRKGEPSMSDTPTILYTLTDEAPRLATQSLLPVVQAYAATAGIAVETRDISLAARIASQFPEARREDQRVAVDLAELGKLATTPETNNINLPNISHSVAPLPAANEQLTTQGFALPGMPDEPGDESEREDKARYDRVKGSAVNPVLREGNSDRRAPASVKAYARKHPHRMGKWERDSKTHVAHMDDGDFYGSEQSVEIAKPGSVRIEFEGRDGRRHMLRTGVPVLAGELIDASVMDAAALSRFVTAQIEDARARGVLFSLHLKATMMKVSDPIMFGIAVEAFYKPV